MPRLSAGRVQSVATRIVVERERARMRFRVRRILGRRGPVRDQARRRPTATRRRSPPRWSRSTTAASPPAATSTRTPAGPAATCCISTSRAPAAWSPACRTRPFAGHPGRGEALPAPAVRAVHDQHAAAGGRPQAAVLGRADDAHRAAAVRERLHHLHADRLDQPVRDGAHRGPAAGPRALRRRVRAGRSRAATSARSRTPRRRTRRSAPPATPSAPPGAVADELSRDEFRLYELVWQRTLASQMADAVGTSVSVRLAGTSTTGERGRVRRVAARRSRSPASSGRTWRASTRRRAATTASGGCRGCARASRSTRAS